MAHWQAKADHHKLAEQASSGANNKPVSLQSASTRGGGTQGDSLLALFLSDEVVLIRHVSDDHVSFTEVNEDFKNNVFIVTTASVNA